MRYFIVGLLCLGLAGCASVGSMPHLTGTTTDLGSRNYRVVKSSVRGSDSGFSFLGMIPIVSPSYANAMADLHKKVSMEGKAMAFANVAQDRSSVYLILFSVPTITITADVVEFLEEKSKKEEQVEVKE